MSTLQDLVSVTSDSRANVQLTAAELSSSDAAYGEVFRALRADGMVTITLTGSDDGAAIAKNLMYNGFANIKTEGGIVTAQKPNYGTNAAASINVPTAKSNVWSLNADDDDDGDVIDEAALLAKDTFVAPKVDMMDCGTGAVGVKKACKNCSCGLAELEQQGLADKAPVKSACGNVRYSCYMWRMICCY